MPDNLILVCAVAFAAVFSLLTVLALMMRVLIALFPVRKSASDTAVMGAINTAVSTMLPGARVIKIEETTPVKKL